MQNKRERIRKILFCFFAAIAVLCAAYLIWYAYSAEKHVRLEREISGMVQSAVTSDSSPAGAADSYTSESAKASGTASSEPAPAPGTASSAGTDDPMKALLEINPDFLGVLSIPGIKGFSEPFVQAQDNEKYLVTDFKGNKSNHGTIFIDAANAPDFTDSNTVFYGHNMRDGSMFAKLQQYSSRKNYLKAPVIEIERPSGKTVWLVFAAYTCEADWGYTDTKLSGDSFAFLLKAIKERSVISTGIDVNENDHIITLSTCAYAFWNARFVVHARLLREGEAVPE